AASGGRRRPLAVRAVTSASAMLTRRVPSISPRSTTIKSTEFENRFPGFRILTATRPTADSADAGTNAVNCDTPTNVVCVSVDPTNTTEPPTKFWPLIVSENGPPYNGTIVCESPGGLADGALMEGTD